MPIKKILSFKTGNTFTFLLYCRVVPPSVVLPRGTVSLEVLTQTQGGSELRSGVFVLHAGLVPHCVCKPSAPPSAWLVNT